jgi:glycerol-3-phosphate acyltransferase PlsX
MPRLILDAMGGDYAPLATLEGALEALPELEREPDGNPSTQTSSANSGGSANELVLVGDEAVIREHLKHRKFRPLADAIERSKNGTSGSAFKVSIVHAPDSIDMADSIRAVRSKPNASINVGCKMAGESYSKRKELNLPPAGFISAGHSGAMMASALLNMGRIKGVERPAIAVKLPTLSEDGCVFLDVGANVDCKPEHLRDFAVMGAIFGGVERVSKTLPRVGVLSNGEEKSKGNELTRAATALISELACLKGDDRVADFIGNVEGKEIFKGQVDVVVADGFVGNVVLKSLEGLGSAVVNFMKRDARKSLIAPFGFLLASNVFRRLKRKLDYAETGAAPLLGVAGYAFICHGRSDSRAIKNAILRARTVVRGQFVEKLEAALTK